MAPTPRTLASLRPNPKNPRTITAAKRKMLAASLERFGDLGGIVFNNVSGQLVGGHQRIAAFNAQTPVVVTKAYDVPTRTGTVTEGYVDLNGERFSFREVAWDDATEKAANLAANKGAGEFDMELVGKWLNELGADGFDLNLTMFDPEEIKSILPDQSMSADDVIDQPVPDASTVQPKVKLGQVYSLGRHRLVCGDCTSDSTASKVMRGCRANMTFTSPPYNAAKNGHLNNRVAGFDDKYKNNDDSMSDGDYFKLLCDFTKVALHNSDYVFVNLQLLTHNRVPVLNYQSAFTSKMKDVLVWNKKQCPPNIVKGAFNTKFEYIFCISDDVKTRGFPSKWQGQHPNVVETNSNSDNKFAGDHKAGFPVALPAWFMEKFEWAKIIYEPFCGTGTTIICAEQMGRTCYAVELDPLYCDITIARWESLTGQKAKLLGNGTDAEHQYA